MSSVAAHIQKLNVVQRRALPLVADEEDQQQAASTTSLEHHRDASALVVCQKAQVRGFSHLAPPEAAATHSAAVHQNCGK